MSAMSQVNTVIQRLTGLFPLYVLPELCFWQMEQVKVNYSIWRLNPFTSIRRDFYDLLPCFMHTIDYILGERLSRHQAAVQVPPKSVWVDKIASLFPTAFFSFFLFNFMRLLLGVKSLESPNGSREHKVQVPEGLSEKEGLAEWTEDGGLRSLKGGISKDSEELREISKVMEGGRVSGSSEKVREVLGEPIWGDLQFPKEAAEVAH